MKQQTQAQTAAAALDAARAGNHFTAAVWTPALNSPGERAGVPVEVMVLKSSLNGQRRVEGRKVVTILRDDGNLAEVWAHEVLSEVMRQAALLPVVYRSVLADMAKRRGH